MWGLSIFKLNRATRDTLSAILCTHLAIASAARRGSPNHGTRPQLCYNKAVNKNQKDLSEVSYV